MDVWHFWLSIAVFFALIVAIVLLCVRKYKDKHRINKLEKSLDDLELYFKQLAEEMTVVNERNLQTMSEKIESMKQLLEVADKKILMADDILRSVDDGLAVIKERNVSLNPLVPKKNRDEYDIAIQDINFQLSKFDKHLNHLLVRISNLEKGEFPEGVSLLSGNLFAGDFGKRINEMISKEVAERIKAIDNVADIKERLLKDIVSDVSNVITDKVSDEISAQLSFLTSEFDKIANAAIEMDESITNVKVLEPSGGITSKDSSGKVTILYPPNPTDDEGVEIPSDVNDDVLKKILDDSQTVDYRLIKGQVMDLYDKGYTIPKIVESLKMSRGEIELIIKMKNMKKVAVGG